MERQRTLAPNPVDDVSAREAESRLRWDRKDVDALFTRAASLASAGRTDEAVSCLDRIAELAPDYPGLWRLLARLYGELGEVRLARLCLQRASMSP